MNLFELFVKIGADTSQAEKGMKSTQGVSETLTNKIKVMSAQFEAAQQNVDKLTKEFNESVNKAGATDKATQELAKKLSDAEKEAEKFAKELDAIQKEAEQSEEALDDCNEEIKDTGEKAEKSGKGLSNFASKLGSGLKTAAKVGTAAVAAVGSGIVALGTYAAKVGGDFEAQMSKVSAISGATGDDLQALEDKAKQLGIDTKFSATEAGQAFEYMAMAGWKTDQMLNGVSGIMDLAAASGEDLASVSDIVTDAMTAFGLSADQSTHFADVLAKASSNANTNVGLMGETFKYVAPVAGAMGYSVEDTAVAIGLMANAGIKGSQAGTALRGMLARLAKPTDEVSWAMDQLGLSLSNTDGTMKDFDEILLDLRKGFSGLGEDERTEMAALLAGQEAMSGLLSIVSASDADFNKLTESINNSDGASKQMADTMANNLKGKFTLLKSSAEGFGIALYDKIQQPLTDMVSWAVDGLNELTKAFNENGVDGLVEAAANILNEAIKEIVNGLPKIVDLAIRVIDSFIGGLNKNLDTIVSGAVSVVVTLANGILNMLPQIIKLGLDLIVSLANGIAEALPELIPTIVDVVLQIVDTLTSPDTLLNLVDACIAIILALADGLIDALPRLIEAVPVIIGNLVQAIIEAVPQLIFAAGELIWGLITGLNNPDNTMALLEGTIKMLGSINKGIVSYYKQMFEKGKEIFTNIKDGFMKFIDDPKKWGKDLIDNFIGGIKERLNKLKDTVANVAQSVKDFLGFSEPKKGPLSNFHTYAPDMMDLFAKGIRDNEDVITDQIEKSFDFGERTMKFGAEYGGGYGVASAGGDFGGTSIGDININIYGADMQNADELADTIAEKLQQMTIKRGEVFA